MKIDRIYEALGCALAVLRRVDSLARTDADDDDRVRIALRNVVEAKQKLSVAQTRLGEAIADRDQGMLTKWCGHRVRKGCSAEELLACGCGTAAF